MEKFIFGCATAAYQIEGAHNINKEESIWDRFTKIEGNILDGSDASIACNSYHRYKEDINLLKNLGVSAYRFSISWCRIVNKNGEKIKEGIEYYTNLAKLLKENGIEPFVTLYHWDMPGYIQDKGGFLNDEISNDFANYTDIITKALKPYAKYFITINEPQCIMFLGHRLGLHAPGLKLNDKDMLHAIHNLLLCHGKAVSIIRANIPNSKIGFSPCSRPMVPKDNDPLLYKKCYEKYFELKDYDYPNLVSIYSDPIFLGDYPKDYYILFKDILPKINDEDLDIISQPIDYIYQNIYTGNYYILDKNNELKMEEFYPGYPEGNIDWLQVVPEALYYGPKFLYDRYKKPIIISENGFCNNDVISLDGHVHDPERSDYIKRYLIELKKVSKEIPILGYFYWSLLDNFEWNSGLKKRFGLVYVDYRNQNRLEKDSYYTYQNIIKEGF